MGWLLQLCSSSIMLWFFLNLCISYQFQNQFVNFQTKTTTKENPAGILIGITWNLQIILGKTDIFTTPSTNEYMERGGRAKGDKITGKPAAEHMPTLWPSNSVPRYTPTHHIHTCTQHVHTWTLHIHTCTARTYMDTPRTYMHTPVHACTEGHV